ncbi:MAG TPA: hypothetical protein VLM40_03360 [Gemmata sp.]|nr:hypothetical protein [Gemmata sp.]
MRAAVQALQPFGDMDLEQLTDFLKRAAEFRRSGEVSAINVRGLDELAKAARNLGEAVKTAGFTEVDAAAHILEERQALSNAMATVAE